MHKLILAAPFGNYLHFPNTTRILGTYTLQRRGGWPLRLWRILSTVRYHNGTWVNRLGLPNPGIRSLHSCPPDAILSIHGFTNLDWILLLQAASDLGVGTVELNVSCPNVDQVMELPHIEGFSGRIIAKLPPVGYMTLGRPLYDLGVRTFHLCNTLPSPAGGRSGKVLKPYSLQAVRDFRQLFGKNVTLIGGGGVKCLEDVKDYVRAGADHVAVASMLFNPFSWYKVKTFTRYLG